jgi:ribosome recycling factor
LQLQYNEPHMIEEIEMQIMQTTEHFDKALEHLAFELNKIRAGKASPAMLNGLMVDYYGSPTPLSQSCQYKYTGCPNH